MVTEYSKAPTEIFVQENDDSMKYGINQDGEISGMVKYIRQLPLN